MYCFNHVASAVSEIRPPTSNAYWKAVWLGCVSNSVTIQISILSIEIIILAHETGGGVDTLSQNDSD